jgi:hypothetical protein
MEERTLTVRCPAPKGPDLPWVDQKKSKLSRGVFVTVYTCSRCGHFRIYGDKWLVELLRCHGYCTIMGNMLLCKRRRYSDELARARVVMRLQRKKKN